MAKWKTALGFDILLRNHGCQLFGLKNRDRSTCYQHSAQKPASLMVRVVNYSLWNIWKGTITAERYMLVLDIRSNPDYIFFREGLGYFRKTMLKHILHALQQRGFGVEVSRCWTVLPAVQIFHLLKTFGAP